MSSWRRSIWWLALICWQAAAGLSAAQAQANAVARLTAVGGPFTVGDPIPLTLTVAHPAGHRVILPDWALTTAPGAASWGPVELRAVGPVALTATADGREATTWTVQIVAWTPGSLALPPLALQLADPAGRLTPLTAEAPPLAVAPVLAADETALRDLRPQAELPIPAVWPRYLALGLPIAAAALLLWRRRPRPAPVALRQPTDPRSPHAIALAALDALIASPQTDPALTVQQAADVLRRYLEAAWGLPAAVSTTAETAQALRSAALLSPALQKQFVAFLRSADLVKFARLVPDREATATALATARQIVETAAAVQEQRA